MELESKEFNFIPLVEQVFILKALIETKTVTVVRSVEFETNAYLLNKLKDNPQLFSS